MQRSMRISQWWFYDRKEWNGFLMTVDEPDKVVWRDPTTLRPCLIRRSTIGVLCGYVGLLKVHPWHGLEASEVPFQNVHGGLTFSGYPLGIGPDGDYGIGNGVKSLWWIGFDCGHGGDYIPAVSATPGPLASEIAPAAYRNIAYVAHEVRKLAIAAENVPVGGDE